MTTNGNGAFTGKVAFVTGAGSGIGRATALAFARAGASMVVADVSEPGNQETARQIEGLGGRVLAVRCDVTRSEDVKAALEQTTETPGRLDFAFKTSACSISGSPRTRSRRSTRSIPACAVVPIPR